MSLSCQSLRSVWITFSDTEFGIWVVLDRGWSWTQWSLWLSSNSGGLVIVTFRQLLIRYPWEKMRKWCRSSKGHQCRDSGSLEETARAFQRSFHLSNTVFSVSCYLSNSTEKKSCQDVLLPLGGQIICQQFLGRLLSFVLNFRHVSIAVFTVRPSFQLNHLAKDP